MQAPLSPWGASSDPPDYLEQTDIERLDPVRMPLPRTKSGVDRGESLLPSAGSGLLRAGSSGLVRASSGVKEGVKSALERTSSFQSALSRSSSAGAKEVLSALQHTATGDFHEASIQAESAWRRFERGSVAHGIARVLICIFFLDCGLERYQNWKFYQTDFMKQRVTDYPYRYKDPGFPFFDLLVIVPCALLTMMGITRWFTAALLVLDMLRDSIGIIATGTIRVFQHRLEPDELTAKHLAMLGSAVLILVHSVRERYASSNTVAGLLIGEPDRTPSHLKSAVLLFGRLALTVLFVTVGISQAKRVIQRDWEIYANRSYLRPDGHDNNFLLFEAILAVPFAIGYRTRVVGPLLALTLLGEAVVCWNPLESWPSVQYQSHVRSHFATNLGAAGGLLLLQTYGAGRYTLDKLLAARKKQ